jgi:hypothetical protein
MSGSSIIANAGLKKKINSKLPGRDKPQSISEQ